MDYRISLVPHTTTTVVMNIDKHYMDYVNGTGFEIVVPGLSDSENYRTESDINPETEPETEPVNRVGSSGGGCDTGFAVSGLVILMSALIFRKKSRYRTENNRQKIFPCGHFMAAGIFFCTCYTYS